MPIGPPPTDARIHNLLNTVVNTVIVIQFQKNNQKNNEIVLGRGTYKGWGTRASPVAQPKPFTVHLCGSVYGDCRGVPILELQSPREVVVVAG